MRAVIRDQIHRAVDRGLGSRDVVVVAREEPDPISDPQPFDRRFELGGLLEVDPEAPVCQTETGPGEEGGASATRKATCSPAV